jgi:hypothetical protein
MPCSLFEYHPMGALHPMGGIDPDDYNCCDKDVECLGSNSAGERSGSFHAGDYNYTCKVPQEKVNCSGEKRDSGPPGNCTWDGRGDPLPGSQPLPGY